MIKEVVVILLNMPLKIFQSPFVYWRQLSEDDHRRIKSKMMKDINLLDEVKQDKDDGLHNATTNYVTKYNKNELVSEDYIKTIVKDTVTELIQRINGSKNLLYTIDYVDHAVLNAWYTKYEKGGNFDWHDHYSVPYMINDHVYHSSFSLIYILNDESDKNVTIFGTNQTVCSPPFQNRSGILLDTGDFDDIKEGTVIVFPSNLSHKVLQSMNSNRIVVSYNIYSRY